MGDHTIDQDLKCPDCGRQFHVHSQATWSPEVMTVRYQIAEGRKMALEDLCSSLLALSKSLRLIGKDLGVKLAITPTDFSITDGEIAVSIAIVEFQNK